jgi:leucyl aminopeptidase (aminopeptidase T)
MIGELELELAVSAHKTVNDVMNVKPGETLLITIDSMADFRLAVAMARAGECVGAKTMVAYHSTASAYGKAGESRLPESLSGAIERADAWIELNGQWLVYNTAWERATAEGTKTRYFHLGKMDADAIWRCLGALDLKALREFMTAVANMTRAAKEMTITTPAGANVSFTNAGRPVTNECGDASTPGAHFMLGQIGWAPIEESIEGEIVFDGSFSGGGHMDLGILRNPIKFVIKKGRIVDIVGQEEAKIVEEWLANLNDERMYYLAHTCYGFNPGARLSGGCTEDERIWGCTQWGFGYQGAFFEGALGDAVTHGDGICLNSSVWLDGKQFLDAGKVIEPKLGQLAKKLGK